MTAMVLLTAPATFLAAAEAVSQTEPGTISGTVVSADRGLPIAGAVVALDAGIRTASDSTGAFSVQAPSGGYRVAAIAPGCHVGIGTVEVRAGTETRVRITVPLPPDAESLLEAWELRTRSLGESVRVVDEAQIRRRRIQSVADAVRLVAPDMIGRESAQAGGRQELLNRGAPTVAGPRAPLVVVDGLRLPQGGHDILSTIDPGDIARIEVARGATGGWIYGSQAANGIIRITTKDARSGFDRQTPAAACSFTFPR